MIHPTFAQAVTEIESLGFRVSENPGPDSIPYTVIGGRSNARWWLVPLSHRQVTVSGLALFQPVIPSARWLKGAAVVMSAVGLVGLWARKKLYISGQSGLADIFGGKNLSYAFFTGTESPHRKVAVQIMDQAGNIKGFAKVTLNPVVKPLLRHEAKTLNDLHRLDLQTASIPRVLFCGDMGGAEVLVTDTLKTARTKTVTTLNEAHLAFLRELAEKTVVRSAESGAGFVEILRQQYAEVAEWLPSEWRMHLTQAMEVVAGFKGDWGPRSLSHGDFTPWNTFFVDGKLYVFDWEYASYDYPRAYDFFHFFLTTKKLKKKNSFELIELIRENSYRIVNNMNDMHVLMLSYLVINFLFYAQREPSKINGYLDGNGKIVVGLIDNLTDQNHGQCRAST